MKGMTELMEHCLHLVKGKKTWFSVDRLAEVADIHYHRTDIHPINDLLVHEVVHPCSSPLRAAREIVCKKDSDEASVRVSHLEALDFIMIYRDILKFLEVQTEKLVSSVEDASTHILHLEIRLCLLLVEGVLCLADLLCIICPVPWLDHRTLRKKACCYVLVHHGLHVHDLLLCPLHSRSHDACKEGVHCLRIAGHLVCQNHLGRVLISKEFRLLYTESHHLHYEVLGIVLVGVVSA